MSELYSISEEADFQRNYLRLSSPQLQAMLSASATVTHPMGNKRFMGYVFKVTNGTVEYVGLYEVGMVDAEYEVFYDSCPLCESEGLNGCAACNYSGEVRISRPIK